MKNEKQYRQLQKKVYEIIFPGGMPLESEVEILNLNTAKVCIFHRVSSSKLHCSVITKNSCGYIGVEKIDIILGKPYSKILDTDLSKPIKEQSKETLIKLYKLIK